MTTIPVAIPVIFVRRMLSGKNLGPQLLQACLRDAGIQKHQIEVDGSLVSADQYIALFSSIVDRLDDEGLGFFSRRIKRGSFALAARGAIGAATLEKAIRHVAHTYHLVHDDVRMGLIHDGDLAGIELKVTGDDLEISDAGQELLVRVFWRLFAWLVGGHLPIARFDFAFELPEFTGHYDSIFPGLKRFACQRTVLWFDANLLQTAVCRDEASLRQFVARSFAEAIVPSHEEGLHGKVRRLLQQAQPEWLDLERTAEAMHMATSTLQRRLAIEGVTFQEVKNNLRRDIAVFRLQTSQVALPRLASELGFADNAAFTRAFKQWTGSPPRVYQRTMSAGVARARSPAHKRSP